MPGTYDVAVGGPIEVSVVIPAYNSEATLADQLVALGCQEGARAFEVIVADNGSTDRTRKVADRGAPGLSRVRVVDASDRRGAAHARNVGAAHAEGRYLLFCDADDVADPSWVEKMAVHLERAEGVGGHLATTTINSQSLSRLRPSPTELGLPDAFGRWRVPIGASCGIRRDRFVDLGGFDESFTTAAGEDTDLFIRLQLGGGTVVFAADAVMHYRLRPGVGAMWRQAKAYGIANVQLRRRFADEGVPPLRVGELIRDLPWMAKCVVLAPVSRERRGQLIWWTGHTIGMLVENRRQ